jgi:hypothetical protein
MYTTAQRFEGCHKKTKRANQRNKKQKSKSAQETMLQCHRKTRSEAPSPPEKRASAKKVQE